MSGPPAKVTSVLGIPPVPLRKLYTFATPCDLACVALGICCSTAGGCVLPLFSLIFGKCLTTLNDPTVSTAAAADQLATLALYFFLIALGASLLTFLQNFLAGWSTEKQTREIRAAYCRNLLRLDFTWYDTHRAGEAVSRLADSTLLVTKGLKKVVEMMSYVGTFVCGFSIGFSVSWKLTLVIAGCAPIFAAALSFLVINAIKGQKNVTFSYSRAGGIADEAISLQRAVSAYGGEQHEFRRYSSYVRMAERAGIRTGRSLGLSVGIMLTTFMAMYGIACYAGANFVVMSRKDNPQCRYNPTLKGCFSGGDIITTFVAVLLGAVSMGQIGPVLGDIMAGRAAAADLFGVIDAVPSVDVSDDSPELYRGKAKADSADNNGLKIEFHGVTFSYPSRPDVEVLSNFSLTISPGEKIGVVGQSGSGKSTLVLLVMRAYDPQKGDVLVDGVNVRKWHLQSLRKMLGLVQQEPVLFGCSIRENIAMGVPTVTVSEVSSVAVEKAAKAANAHDFIMELPKAYDTLAGTSVSASQLSGGQRQRICIARALIRAPRIMLLDEATSALDTTSERTVQAALDAAGAESSATTLIIAHRLSTLANVHRIVVMERGIIVEEGSPAELSQKPGGLFKAMKQAQEVSAGDGQTATTGFDSRPEEANTKQQTASADPAKVDPAALAHKRDAYSRKNMIKRLIAMQADSWLVGLFAVLIAPASGGIQPCVSLVYGGVIPIFFNPDDDYMVQQSLTYLGYFFCIAAAYLVGVTCRISTFTWLGEVLTRKLREASFRAILQCPGAFFDNPDNSIGVLTSKLASDSTVVKGISGDALGSSLEGVGALCSALIIAFTSTWQLSLVLMSCFPFLVIGAVFEFRSFGAFTKDGNTMAEGSNVVQESVTASRAVAAYGLQARTTATYEKALITPFRNGVRGSIITALGQSFQKFMLMATYSLCFYVGGQFINMGILQFSQLIKAFLAVTLAAEAVGRITSMSPDLTAATDAARSVFTLIDAGEESPINPMKTSGFMGENKGGIKLEFRNLTFAYPSRPDVIVLRNFSLTISPGEFTGVVGQSGSGKSTLVLLAMRTYDPQAGEVLVDDVNVKDWNLAALRNTLGLVQQEPALFADSITYNIGYGVASPEKPEFGKGAQPKEVSDEKAKEAKEEKAEEATFANIEEDGAAAEVPQADSSLTPPQVVEAAASANATLFISRLPSGFATYCGARGSLLSGGQKQRVAIARALLRQPRALLLDEATAALDSKSEQQVQAALDRVIEQSRLQIGDKTGPASRTTLVIAHRLSTLANADRIVVLEKGKVVEQGSHQELMRVEGGKYRALAQAQGAA